MWSPRYSRRNRRLLPAALALREGGARLVAANTVLALCCVGARLLHAGMKLLMVGLSLPPLSLRTCMGNHVPSQILSSASEMRAGISDVFGVSNLFRIDAKQHVYHPSKGLSSRSAGTNAAGLVADPSASLLCAGRHLRPWSNVPMPPSPSVTRITAMPGQEYKRVITLACRRQNQ